jgi:hypothetical protein
LLVQCKNLCSAWYGQGSQSDGYQIPTSAQQQPTFVFTKATFDPYVGGIFQAPNALGNMV